MELEKIKLIIERVFDNNEDVNPNTTGEIKQAIDLALNYLDKGELRVADPIGNSQWKVNQWLKKAVLLSSNINLFIILEILIYDILHLLESGVN